MTKKKTETAEELKPRKVVICRDLYPALNALSGEMKQLASQFMMTLRCGAAVNFVPLPGASSYEAVVLRKKRADAGLYVVVKRAQDFVLLLWAGDEASATDWAARHWCEPNPRTGMLQIYERAAPVQSTQPAGTSGTSGAAAQAEAPQTPKAPEVPADVSGEEEEQTEEKEVHETPASPTLFAALTDDELLDVGLPEQLLPAVRAVVAPAEFEAMQKRLPESVYEALTWYVQGESWEEVRKAYGRKAGEAGPQQTPWGTLDPGRFYVVDSDATLREIMEKPLEEWRVFLHSSQVEIVTKAWRGAVRVTGGAGTGKTVVALHRARHLVRLPDWQPDQKLLFTTFTKNLAVDLEWQLKSLCTKEEMRRIEVRNIDSWLASYVRQHGAGRTIVYPTNPAYEDAWRTAMMKAPVDPAFPESFYRSEWEEVVLANHVATGRDYLFAPRVGRGTALTRTQRRAIWPVFEEMRLQLNLHDLMTVEDAAVFAAESVRRNHPEGLYRAVVADEIQDFKPDMLRLLRALAWDVSAMKESVEGDLFMVGDPHQRIYAKPVVFSACGISIRGRRSRKLRVNYRTTDEIRKTADSIYRRTKVDDMEGGTETKTGYASLRHGSAPEVFCAQTPEDEVRWIAGRAKFLASDQSPLRTDYSEMCVVARSRALTEYYAEGLKREGIPVRMVSRTTADNPDDKGLRVATMHRVKGLEFKVVFVAGMNDGEFPQPAPKGADAPQRRQHMREEKALFYVAASRASSLLFFSSAGGPSRFMPKAG